MQVYQRKADASARVFHSGRHRDAAGLYLQAYRDAPSSGPNKWHIFHGYTSILREEYFKATDSDISSVSKISSDKSEVKLVRVEAAAGSDFTAVECNSFRLTVLHACTNGAGWPL